VVGIDINKHAIDFAKSKLADDYQKLSNIVEFKHVDDIKNEKFDIVLSKDCFEHYADPENFIFTMKQHLKKEGILVIGFGPLWKAPYGGHINFMTKVPWAHLIFPESVIMAERKRFRPDENAESFEQVAGGLNKMTFKRYLNIIQESGLEIEYFKTNVSSKSRLMGLFNVLRRIPFCKEFFTYNLYSIMHSTEMFERVEQ
jgi:SAM-dependent methyltransferase